MNNEQNNSTMTLYRLYINTNNGIYRTISFRAATITDAIEAARKETTMRIDLHNADEALSQLHRRSDMKFIWQDIVAAPEC